MNAIEGADQDPESKGVPTVRLPSQDQVTAVQVNTLLQSVQALNHALMARLGPVEEATQGPDDGGVCSALDAVIIRACNQLENIFQDNGRWGIKTHSFLEEKLSAVYAAHLDLLKVQKEAVMAMGLPHRVAPPKLVQLGPSQWAAIFGDPAKLEDCLIGVGANPAAALADYDKVFSGTKTEQENEQTLEQLDGSGDHEGAESEGGREDLHGDSEGVGPNPGSDPV